MKKSKLKIIIPLVAIFLIAAIVAGVLIFPVKKASDSKLYSYVSDKQEAVEFSENFKEAIKTTYASLFYDEATSAVAVSTGDSVFNSFSVSAAGGKNASIINVSLRDKNGSAYIMNSTDNSVAFDSFVISAEKNKLTFKFSLFADKKSAHNKGNGSVWAEIPVMFSLVNGAFKVSVNTSEIKCADGICVEKISLLPGLFSVDIPDENMAYTIPDGSGAEILLDVVTEEELAKTLYVYGSDVVFDEYSAGANLPCFSFFNGKALNSVVIDGGDALSQITVKRNKNGGGMLYNTFVVTSFGKVNGELLRGETYEGELSQLYYIDDDNGSDYNQLASVVRDLLIEKQYLPSEFSGKFADLPFFVNVIGSYNGKKESVYTTFENSAEIVALLKSRGVRSTALRFSGGLTDGISEDNKKQYKLNKNLGDVNDYNEFCNIAIENNGSAWLDINLMSTPAKEGAFGYKLNGRISDLLGGSVSKSSSLGYNKVYSNISSAYKFMDNFENSNVCLNDASFLLYTDVDSGIGRQTALNTLRDKLEALGVGGGIMLDSPAVYLMNSADAVFDMPETSSLEKFDGVSSVPLLQMVLHGSVCYGTSSVNLSDNPTDAILKAVEFGASPTFTFTYNDGGDLDYGPYASQVAKFYSDVKQIMPLMDMQITNHEKVVSGVYKVVYDYSKTVYVNYNPSVVEVDGILVSAKDYVII